MLPIPATKTARSPRLEVFTSLLLILFCLFKFERYQSAQLSGPAVSRQVCEQIETVPPCYNIPKLADTLLADEDIASAIAQVSPPKRTMLRVVEREFTAVITLRMKLHDKSFVNTGRFRPSCRPTYSVSSRSDEPSDPFSS